MRKCWLCRKAGLKWSHQVAKLVRFDDSTLLICATIVVDAGVDGGDDCITTKIITIKIILKTFGERTGLANIYQNLPYELQNQIQCRCRGCGQYCVFLIQNQPGKRFSIQYHTRLPEVEHRTLAPVVNR